VYVTHFPIPQDELNSHECNQRMVLLYGVGKARDDARHIIKKITKEVMKLFTKKNCMEITNGEKSKRKKEKETFDAVNYEAIFLRFQKLSYYDQHALTSTVTSSIVESFSAFAAGTAVYLPQIENLSFLLDLMEFCLHVNGLLEFLLQVLKELPEVEAQLHVKGSMHAGSYATTLCLGFVAVLRKYHAYLLVSTDSTCAVFERWVTQSLILYYILFFPSVCVVW
jgi:mediator of RNA polymerase II transcription subunit 12